MKVKILVMTGIFLMIFSLKGFLLFDSSIPECKGFTGMGWFVFLSMGFEPRAISSNPECLTPFYAQTGFSIIFAIGVWLVLYPIIKRHKEKFRVRSNIGR